MSIEVSKKLHKYFKGYCSSPDYRKSEEMAIRGFALTQEKLSMQMSMQNRNVIFCPK